MAGCYELEGRRTGMIDKLLNLMEKFNIKRASELINNKPLHPSVKGALTYLESYRFVTISLEVD